jgi:hypothetical protein
LRQVYNILEKRQDSLNKNWYGGFSGQLS